MKQKIIFSLLTGVAVFAVPCVSYADLGAIQPGFFVGLAADGVIPNYGFKTTTSSDIVIKKTSNSMLLRPDIYGGYGELVASNNLYIGFDVGLQLGAKKTVEMGYYNSTPPSSSPVAVTSGSEGTVYYADVMPGFVFGNQSNVFYGIVGAAHGSFDLSQTGNAPFAQSEGHFGYRIGVGDTFALTDSFGVGIKYVFTNFGDVGFTNGTFQYQLSPKNNELSLGISYTFGGSSNADARGPFVGD